MRVLRPPRPGSRSPFAAALAFLASAVAGPPSGAQEAVRPGGAVVVPYQRDGLHLQLVAGTERFHSNGRLEGARLARPATLQGIRLRDAVELTASGRLRQGVLDGDQRLGGRRFKGGTPIGLFEGGAVSFGDLVADTSFGGLLVKGYPTTSFFHASGKLSSGTLVRDQTVGGIEAKAESRLELHESGVPRSVQLGRAQRVGPLALPADAKAYLRADGSLEQVYLPGVLVHDGMKLGGASTSQLELRFHPNGALQMATSAADQRVLGVPAPKGSTIWFSAAGKLEALSPSRPVRVHGVELVKDLRFDAAGRLASGWLAAEQTVGGVAFRADYGEIEFHPNGRVRAGITAGAPQTVQGVRVMPSSRIELYDNGKLASALLEGTQKIGGLFLANSGGIFLPSDGGPNRTTRRGIELYRSGALKRGYLARDQRVHGWLFRGVPSSAEASPLAEVSLIELYETGKPKLGNLARPQVLDGKPYGPGWVHLDEAGKVLRFKPTEPSPAR